MPPMTNAPNDDQFCQVSWLSTLNRSRSGPEALYPQLFWLKQPRWRVCLLRQGFPSACRARSPLRRLVHPVVPGGGRCITAGAGHPLVTGEGRCIPAGADAEIRQHPAVAGRCIPAAAAHPAVAGVEGRCRNPRLTATHPAVADGGGIPPTMMTPRHHPVTVLPRDPAVAPLQHPAVAE